MKLLPLLAAYLIVLVLSVPQARAQFDPSTDDSWDVSNGGMVTSNSALNLSSPENMFGAAGAGSTEPGNVIFQDNQQTGFVHFVEWTVPGEIIVRSIVLNIAHDGAPFDARARGISEFLFYAGDALELIFQYAPANPYGNSEPPPEGRVETFGFNNLLSLCVNIPPTAATQFRAEFVQFGGSGPASGPRIVELDGYEEEQPNCVEGVFQSGFEAGEGESMGSG